jgi:ABC-2 type transport system permease protein
LPPDAIRSLLSNEHVGGAGVEAVAWCLAITAVSYLWAKYLYDRRPAAA